MKGLNRLGIIKSSGLVLSFIITVVVFLNSGPASAESTGSGTLTINPGGTNGTCDLNGTGFNDFDSPHFWDIFQSDTIHINISPGFSICTQAPGDSSLLNRKCTSGFADCTRPQDKGTCSASGNCTGPTGSKKCSNNNNKTCTASADCSNICTANSPTGSEGSSCSSNADCSINVGTCELELECSGDTSVVIKGHTGNACNVDDDCTGAGETGCDGGQTCNSGSCSIDGSPCTDDSECAKTGLCKFEDSIATTGRTGSGAIDVCYTTRDNTCAEAEVFYCDRLRANVQNPAQTGVFIPTFLRTVTLGDPCTTDVDCPSNAHCGDDGKCEIALDTSEACTPAIPTCTNEVGSFCCGLTQGAYGAPNSVATASGTGVCDDLSNPLTDAGFIPAAKCQGCDVFTGDPNGTTIGIHSTRSVTIDNLTTLIAYLPTGGTAGSFKSSLVGADTHYSAPNQIPDLNKTTGGTKGEGSGVLAGQAMACAINNFLSNCTLPFGGSGTFTASGFGGFKLPSVGTLVCTRRSGPDKTLGTGDDICQAFGYATCVAEKTVQQVIDCANQLLAGQTNSCGCTATDLNNALSNINVQFDQCGNVIDCGGVTTQGVFPCP